MYKLDKSFSKTGTLQSASDNSAYWKTKSVQERLKAAMYLISTAYRLDPDNWPPMDKTFHSTRSLSK